MSTRTTLAALPTPSLLIERAILEANINRMQRLATAHGVALRPHIKTHKSIELAVRQLQAGAVGLAVATVHEAETMASGGVTDIQIANEVVGTDKIKRLVALASGTRVSCAVDSADNARELAAAFRAAGRILPVFLDIDSGLHRCGLSEYALIRSLAETVGALDGLELAGILTHAGHAYAAAPSQIAEIGKREGEAMVELAGRLRSDGIPVTTISLGSTPTAGHAVSVPGISELRPGNYVFNDMMQVSLGVATWEQCALSVLATVISTPTADRAVIDAGSKALSSDCGAHGNRSLSGYGSIVGTALTISRLSEEHGVIESPGHGLALGQRLRVIPNHACAAVNLFSCMYLCEDDRIISRMPVAARA